MKVLITPIQLTGLQGEFLKVLQDARFDTVFTTRTAQLSEQELLEDLPGCAAVLAGSEPYTRRVIASMPDLRVIARAGVGYDAVDMAAASDHGVVVTTTPGANQDAVAEHAMAFILALAKDLIPKNQAMKAGRWPREPNIPIREQTLGIVGLGRIGKSIAVRAAAFGMRLLACEIAPDRAFVAAHKMPLVSFEELLAKADFVSMHVPLTPLTRRMINRDSLALMKPSAFLINTSRGGVIDEEALLEALKAGRIAGAALDVFAREPAGKNPLLALENVIATPHTAGVDFRSRDEMALRAAQSIVHLLRGEWPAEQVVNPDVKALFEKRRGS